MCFIKVSSIYSFVVLKFKTVITFGTIYKIACVLLGHIELKCDQVTISTSWGVTPQFLRVVIFGALAMVFLVGAQVSWDPGVRCRAAVLAGRG